MTAYQRTVLVVDDEPLLRMILADALAEEGYLVHEAATVLQAVAVLGAYHVDAVVTDIDMPGGLSGLDLAAVIARQARPPKTIVTSGGREMASADLPGEACFLAKPYRVDHVLSLLSGLLGPKALPHAARRSA